MTTATATLNIRKGPGTTYAIIGSIPKGGAVSIDGQPTGKWWPLTYNGIVGYASGDYLTGLPATEPGHAAARNALLSYLHIPYIWGGQSRGGLDCSGLVGEWWKEIGFRPSGFDTTADKLFDGYRLGTLPGTKLTRPQFGALAFYGSGTNAGHVVICYDDVTVIGANGGSATTNTVAKAKERGGVRASGPHRLSQGLTGHMDARVFVDLERVEPMAKELWHHITPPEGSDDESGWCPDSTVQTFLDDGWTIIESTEVAK